MPPPSLFETERLLLRVPVMEDAALIYQRYAHDPEVTRYLLWPPHQSPAETESWIERCVRVWGEETSFPWVIFRRRDQHLLGMVELGVEGHKFSLGYVLARDAWGQGYATEAASTIARWAIAQPAIWRVWSFCDVENTASRRVLEKIGMQCEGTLRRWVVHPAMGNAPRDSFCYSLVR